MKKDSIQIRLEVVITFVVIGFHYRYTILLQHKIMEVFLITELLFNSGVLFLLDKHLFLPINKSTQSFPMKQLRQPCDLSRNECFQKSKSLYGVYINSVKC